MMKGFWHPRYFKLKETAKETALQNMVDYTLRWGETEDNCSKTLSMQQVTAVEFDPESSIVTLQCQDDRQTLRMNLKSTQGMKTWVKALKQVCAYCASTAK